MNSTALKFSRLVSTITCLLLAGCANRHTRTTGETASDIESPHEQIAFYAVPLRCPAAPEIGCGSRAKPVLRELERAPEISEAWLNRAGTQIGVVWSESGSSKARNNRLRTILKNQNLTATELTGHTRVQSLKEFQAGTGWHRSDAVDRLSEEEAGIIAARLLRRVETKSPLPEIKAQRLNSALTTTLKERFLGSPEQPQRTPEEERDVFLSNAAGYLNETELASLREALASGLRPLAGEQ